jgi:hypothetical protein
MSDSKDPIISESFSLKPGFRWQFNGQEVHVNDAQVQLLPHGDHLVCNAIADVDKRQAQRFRWGIYRLGPFVGRDQITDEMIRAMWEPDIERIQQRQVDLHNSFRDTPNVTCPFCGAEIATSLIRPEEATQAQST